MRKKIAAKEIPKLLGTRTGRFVLKSFTEARDTANEIVKIIKESEEKKIIERQVKKRLRPLVERLFEWTNEGKE